MMGVSHDEFPNQHGTKDRELKDRDFLIQLHADMTASGVDENSDQLRKLRAIIGTTHECCCSESTSITTLVEFLKKVESDTTSAMFDGSQVFGPTLTQAQCDGYLKSNTDAHELINSMYRTGRMSMCVMHPDFDEWLSGFDNDGVALRIAHSELKVATAEIRRLSAELEGI